MTALLKKTGAATGEEVFKQARNGDEKALAALEDMARKVACGLAGICSIVNPEVLIMGGAVMSQQEFFEPRLDKYLREMLPPALLTNTRIAFAQLGTAAGFTGALRHFLQKHK